MKNKIKLLGIVIAVIALIGTGETYALYKENSNQLLNTFTKLKDTNIIINETFNGYTKENVSFLVDADVPSYIRVRLVINYLDDSDNIVSFMPVEGEDYNIEINPVWTYKDRYYYLENAVTYDETPVLIESLTNLNNEYKLSVDILAQSSNHKFN